MLKLHLLGSPQIVLNEELLDLRSAKAKALLYYLAMTRRVHSRLALASLLWPDRPDTEARANLRQAVHQIHQAIPDCLATSRDNLSLNTALEVWVDALRFAESMTTALQNPAKAEGQELMRARISLYQGDFLAGFFVEGAEDFEDWASAQRERLHQLAFDVLKQLTQSALAQRNVFEGLYHAQQLVQMAPWHEDAHYYLIQLLAMNGQTQAALAQYDRCRLLLLEHLGDEPSEQVSQLVADIQRGASPYQRRVDVGDVDNGPRSTSQDTSRQSTQEQPQVRPSHNLPLPLSSFVGRGSELADLAQMLASADVRLVSLIGPGGVGKSRLAVELGRLLLPHFADGVWFVDLLPVGEVVMPEQAIADALDLHETAQATVGEVLQFHLAKREMLLLFDNCEHVIDAASLLSVRLLQSAPKVKILTTSREPLRVQGERCVLVPPLSMPDAARVNSMQTLLAYESAQLFIQRAAAHAPSFVADDQNAALIAEICRQLDGIPLAIELVAARLRMLSLQQMITWLENASSARLHLARQAYRNAHPRHQTLFNLIEWSYRLLQPPERRLFVRLAVFADSWSLTAAHRICDEDLSAEGSAQPVQSTALATLEDTLDRLTSLVDKSLVIATPVSDEVRYRFLETIHAFALDKLAALGEEKSVRGLHLNYYLHLAEAWATPGARSQETWKSLWSAELGNMRAALSWSLTSGATQSGLRLALAAERYWFSQSLHSESTQWIGRLLAMPNPAVDKPLRLAALSSIGFTHWWVLGNYGTARVQQGEALQLAQELEDTERNEKSLNNLGGVAVRLGNYEEALAYLEQSLASTADSGNKLNRAWASILMGEAQLAQSHLPEATHHFTEAAQILRQLTNRSLLGYPVRRLGQIALLQRQRAATVLAHLDESYHINSSTGEIEGQAACIAAYAEFFFHVGETEKATKLCAVVAATLTANHAALSGYDAQAYEELCGSLRNNDEALYSQTWTDGMRLSSAEVAALIGETRKQLA